MNDKGELFITNKRNLAADLVSIVLGGKKNHVMKMNLTYPLVTGLDALFIR